MLDMDGIRNIKFKLRQKYILSNTNISNGTYTYFIFIKEEKYLEKDIKKGKIVDQNLEYYTIQSDELYNIPKFFTFLNKCKAQEIMNKLSVDEIRFLM